MINNGNIIINPNRNNDPLMSYSLPKNLERTEESLDFFLSPNGSNQKRVPIPPGVSHQFFQFFGYNGYGSLDLRPKFLKVQVIEFKLISSFTTTGKSRCSGSGSGSGPGSGSSQASRPPAIVDVRVRVRVRVWVRVRMGVRARMFTWLSLDIK